MVYAVLVSWNVSNIGPVNRPRVLTDASIRKLDNCASHADKYRSVFQLNWGPPMKHQFKGSQNFGPSTPPGARLAAKRLESSVEFRLAQTSKNAVAASFWSIRGLPALGTWEPGQCSTLNLSFKHDYLLPVFWPRAKMYGCGSKLNRRGYAGCGPCFYLPGFHFGTGFLSHSRMPPNLDPAKIPMCRGLSSTSERPSSTSAGLRAVMT